MCLLDSFSVYDVMTSFHRYILCVSIFRVAFDGCSIDPFSFIDKVENKVRIGYVID